MRFQKKIMHFYARLNIQTHCIEMIFFFFLSALAQFLYLNEQKTSFTNNSHDRQLMWCEPVNMATEHVWAKKRLINCSYKYTNPKETMLLL